jgi:hypothetical protein
MVTAEKIYEQVEKETGETLLVRSGFACIGEPEDPMYKNYASTAEEGCTFMDSQ